MKKLLFSLLLALPLGVMAQQKIAVVNTQEIMATLPDVKTADTKLQELEKKFYADIKTMQEEYKSKGEAYAKERDGLVDAIRKRREQELSDIEVRIQQSYSTMQEQLQKEQQILLAPIQLKVSNAIKKVSDANGCTYVLDVASLLSMGNDAIDLTSKVKTELGIKATATPATPAKK